MDQRISLLLDVVDRAFDKKSWHGTTLRGALRGLDVETALWRPASDRKNIWEYLLHAAYWKYIVRRKLAGGDGPAFERSPSNFPDVSDPADAKGLKRDLALLKHEHELLRAEVAGFRPDQLGASAGEFTFAQMVQGAAAHDLYHAGQIQLVKRLAGK